MQLIKYLKVKSSTSFLLTFADFLTFYTKKTSFLPYLCATPKRFFLKVEEWLLTHPRHTSLTADFAPTTVALGQGKFFNNAAQHCSCSEVSLIWQNRNLNLQPCDWVFGLGLRRIFGHTSPYSAGQI